MSNWRWRLCSAVLRPPATVAEGPEEETAWCWRKEAKPRTVIESKTDSVAISPNWPRCFGSSANPNTFRTRLGCSA